MNVEDVEKELASKLAKILKKIMKARKWSVKEMAARVEGYEKSIFYNYGRQGQAISRATILFIERIVKDIDLSTDELLEIMDLRAAIVKWFLPMGIFLTGEQTERLTGRKQHLELTYLEPDKELDQLQWTNLLAFIEVIAKAETVGKLELLNPDYKGMSVSEIVINNTIGTLLTHLQLFKEALVLSVRTNTLDVTFVERHLSEYASILRVFFNYLVAKEPQLFLVDLEDLNSASSQDPQSE